jgi:DNA-binding MarR family transcriptional regulator
MRGPVTLTIQRTHAVAVLAKLRQILRNTNMEVRSTKVRGGLTGAQLWTLCEIKKRPGISVTALAAAMALHQSTVSNLIDKLMSRHLVRRRRDDADGRVAHLFLTSGGERAASGLRNRQRGALLEVLEELSPKALHRLDNELEKLLRRMLNDG